MKKESPFVPATIVPSPSCGGSASRAPCGRRWRCIIPSPRWMRWLPPSSDSVRASAESAAQLRSRMNSPTGRLLKLVSDLDALGPAPTLVDLAGALESAQLTLADVAPYVER